jgi:hypothetical protein
MKKILFALMLLIPSISLAYNINSYDIKGEVNYTYDYKYEEILDVDSVHPNEAITKKVSKDIKNLEVSSNFQMEVDKEDTIVVYSNTPTKNINYSYEYSYKEETKADIYSFNIKNTFNENMKKINFDLTFPSELNENNVKIFKNGDEISSKVEYKIKGNNVTGTYNGIIKQNDTIEVRVDYGALYVNSSTIISILVPTICVLIALLTWYAYGKDTKYNISKNPKVPKDMTPLEVALVNNGLAGKDDVYYFLLSLATKGYITITETSNNNFTIERNNDADIKNYREKAFLKTIFRKNNQVSLTEFINIVSERSQKSARGEMLKSVKNEDMRNRFKVAMRNILPHINSKEEKNKYYFDNTNSKRVFLVFLIAIVLVVITSLPFIENGRLYLLPFSVLFSIVTLKLLIETVRMVDINKKDQRLIVLVCLAIIVAFILLAPAFNRNRLYIISFIICCIAVFIILLLYKYMPKRTVYGTKIISKIDGLKLFLKDHTNEEVERVLEINENYLYEILPYAYGFGLEKYVLDLLKERKVAEPKFFKLHDGYSTTKFNNSIQRLKDYLLDEDK